MRTVYPQYSDEEIDRLLRETREIPFIYEPYTQFKETTVGGQYVNISAGGFRYSDDQGPWPPSPEYYNIFMLGGSTTFGYGVSDSETIASKIQQELNIKSDLKYRIYNFGRRYYFSSQERILFEEILSEGIIPNLVVCLDGLNEFYNYNGVPAFSDTIATFFETADQVGRSKTSIISNLPVGRLVRGLRRRIEKKNKSSDAKLLPNYQDSVVIDKVVERYKTNKQIIQSISKDAGISSLFVWQPIPYFKYDTKYHLFPLKKITPNGFSKPGYDFVERQNRDNLISGNFLWLADIQLDYREPLYVDRVHYTAAFSEVLAKEIATQIKVQITAEQQKK